ncbi:Abi family protein [Streptococcus mutans]|uniref:Abi family protein n=2 Tax=Streptococcus mutans TaxID=1309 RepID=UPI0038BD5068
MRQDNSKELLSYNKLIEKMDDIGIFFKEVDESTAKSILAEKNYYYKIASFRKLFPKNSVGKYNIEFALLYDLSSIDMQVRYLFLKMCLDIEHGIKTKLMNAYVKNSKINAYNIVDDYKKFYPQGYEQTINNLKNHPYLSEMYSKRKNRIPIWVLVEVINFGELLNLVERYYLQYPKKNKLKKAFEFGKYAKNIRNTCAHSNVFLLGLMKTHTKVMASIVSLAEQVHLKRKEINYPKLHDLFCLIVLHHEYCSNSVQKYRRKEAIKLLARANRKGAYYSTNSELKKSFKIIRKMLALLNH